MNPPPFPLMMTVYRGRDPSGLIGLRLLFVSKAMRALSLILFTQLFRGRQSALLGLLRPHRMNPGGYWGVPSNNGKKGVGGGPLLMINPSSTIPAKTSGDRGITEVMRETDFLSRQGREGVDRVVIHIITACLGIRVVLIYHIVRPLFYCFKHICISLSLSRSPTVCFWHSFQSVQ